MIHIDFVAGFRNKPQNGFRRGNVFLGNIKINSQEMGGSSVALGPYSHLLPLIAYLDLEGHAFDVVSGIHTKPKSVLKSRLCFKSNLIVTRKSAPLILDHLLFILTVGKILCVL